MVNKSATIFTRFDQTQVLHLQILKHTFCEYTGSLNFSEQRCLLLSVNPVIQGTYDIKSLATFQ